MKNGNPPPVILIVGCGTVSRLFYRPALDELLRLGTVAVGGVVDPNPASRLAMAEHFSCQGFDDLQTGLSLAPDLVILATPPALHHEQAQTAIQEGIHVLCEKPLAQNAKAALEMKQWAAEKKVVLAVGHYKRFFPAALQLKFLIEFRSLGKLRHVNLQEGGKFNWPIQNDSFFKNEKTPGGVLYDIGIHAIDMLLWWMGETSLLNYEDDADGGLEANAKLNLQWNESETSASLFFSRDFPTTNEWIFQFEHALVKWPVNAAQTLHLDFGYKSPYNVQLELLSKPDRHSLSHAQSFTQHLLHVVRAVQEGTSLRTSVDDSIAGLQLIEECYRNRKKSSWSS